MRPIWKGAISFGMVTIPAKLYPATQSKDVRMRVLCPTHHAPIQEKRVCSEGGEELEWKDLTRGVEVGRDEFVELQPEEIEAAKPDSSTTIEIGDFNGQTLVATIEVNLNKELSGVFNDDLNEPMTTEIFLATECAALTDFAQAQF